MQNRSALVLLFAANALSGAAQGMTMLAVPWYFTQVMERSALFGTLYALVSASLLLWRTFTGSLVDRYSRKRIFLILNTVNGLVMLAIALTGQWLGYTPLALAILAFGLTIYHFNIHFPNLYAFCQELARMKDYARINTWIEVQAQVTSVVSGALAGILLSGAPDGSVRLLSLELSLPQAFEAFSLADILLIDASTYGLAVALMAGIRYTPQTRRTVETGSLLKRLRSGWRFLRQRRRLLWFGIGSYSVFTIVLVYSFFLLPQYVRLALGGDADVYGSAEMSFAAGALAAGFLTPPLMRRFGIVGPVQVLLGLGALVMTALAAFPHPTTLYLGTALFGGTNSALRILRITYILRKTPNGVVGRTNSLFSMVNIAERMLFLLLFSMPFFDSPQHIRWPFWGFALFCLASVGMIGWFFQMPRRRSPRPLSGKAAGQTLRDNA